MQSENFTSFDLYAKQRRLVTCQACKVYFSILFHSLLFIEKIYFPQIAMSLSTVKNKTNLFDQ